MVEEKPEGGGIRPPSGKIGLKFSENIFENSISFVALFGNRPMGVCLRFLDL